MKALICSQNRLAALGLATLAADSGVAAEMASLDEAVTLGRSGDLILVYSDVWDDDAIELTATLHAAHARFVVVSAEMGPQERRAALAAGALHAFSQAEDEELGAVLANFRWSAEPTDEHVILANGFVVELAMRRVRRGERYLAITLTEAQILGLLRDEAFARPGRPLPTQRIRIAVWGSIDARSPVTLRGHIAQLRGKVEVDPEHPQVLRGRRGRGYWLELAPRALWRAASGAEA